MSPIRQKEAFLAKMRQIMCLNQVWTKKAENIKKDGQGWFKHMIYLPLPFCRKKRFFAPKIEVYDLPFFGLKKE